VDRNRNVAAAVSKQKLAEFISAAVEFMKKPSEDFFKLKEVIPRSKKTLISEMKSRGTKTVALLFEHGRINENSLYDQLRRTQKSLADEIGKHEFRVFKYDFWTNEKNLSAILVEFDVWSLPKIKHRTGPPIDSPIDNQEDFKTKYRKDRPYIKDGFWVVDTKRKFKEITELTPTLIKEKRGFGKNLRDAKIRVLEDKDVLKIDGKEFLTFMSSFL